MSWFLKLRRIFSFPPRVEGYVTLPTDLLSAIQYLRDAHTIQLAEFKVVGSYFRFDRKAFGILREATDKVLRIPKERAWKERNNFLIWAPAGVGKSSFAAELAKQAEIESQMISKVLDLKDISHVSILEEEVNKCGQLLDDGKSVLVIVDECDRKVGGEYALTVFQGPLDWNEKYGKQVIWIFIGSGRTKEDLVRAIRDGHTKGPDVFRRLGDEHDCHFVIPALTAGDKVIIAAAKALEFRFVRAERIALMAIPLDSGFSTSGDIERRIRSIRRTVTIDKLMFNDLFPLASSAADFYVRHRSILEPLNDLGSIDIRLKL